MRTLTYILLIIGLTLCGDFTTKASRQERDKLRPQSPEILIIDLSKRLPDNPYQQEYEQMLYPTVRIKAGNSTGSGVIFHRRGAEDAENTIYILTAAHVVGDNSTVTTELFYPKNIGIEATVIITDTLKDLALIKPAGLILYSAHLAPRNYTPYLFTPVWAVGCSLGLPPRPSFGYLCDLGVSAVNNWEVSSPILPGNSGGPVYALVPSDDGNARTYEVIGIAVWVHTYKNQLVTTMAGIVPIQDIYTFLNQVKN